jgi:hypothetical protein
MWWAGSGRMEVSGCKIFQNHLCTLPGTTTHPEQATYIQSEDVDPMTWLYEADPQRTIEGKVKPNKNGLKIRISGKGKYEEDLEFELRKCGMVEE